MNLYGVSPGDASVERHEFYVYAWLYPCGLVFYIGKGCGNRDAQQKTNALFRSVVAKIRRNGGVPRVVRWHSNLTETAAFTLERGYIRLFGRRDLGTGVLTNQTDGGEGASGWVASSEWREMRSRAQTGKTLSDGARKKLRAANLGRKHSSCARAKMSASHTGKTITPDAIAKLMAANVGKKHSIGHRQNNASVQRNKSPVGDFKGVSFHSQTGKWRAQITVDRKQRYLGLFASAEQAARAYDEAAFTEWGVGNCYLNYPAAATDCEAA